MSQSTTSLRAHFVSEADLQCKNWQLYHENQKIGHFKVACAPQVLAYGSHARSASEPAAYPGKEYGTNGAVQFGDVDTLDRELASSLTRRTSALSTGSEQRIDLKGLVSVLHGALGPSDHPGEPGYAAPRRRYPSAGATFPCEFYVLVNEVSGLDAAVYYVNLRTQCLTKIGQPIEENQRRAMLLYDEELLRCDAFIFISAMMPRTCWKYGERGYRYALLEAGHVAQNLLISATSLGMESRPFGGFVETDAEDILDLDGVEEIALYCVALKAGG